MAKTLDNQTNPAGQLLFAGNEKTIANKQRFLELFEPNAGSISAICKALGISRRAYYNWMEDDESFRTAVEDAQESLYDYVESQMHTLIKEGNATMIIFFAKTKMKSRGYVERSEFDHTSKGQSINAPISLVVHGSASKLLDGQQNITIQL